jgi:hypothetical protein
MAEAEHYPTELQIGVPASLGLSEAQMRRLAENLQNELVEIFRGTQVESEKVRALKVKNEVV